ncbi:MAG: lipopolysaccharide biosynthesis protein [Bacteroidales bacterium]|nr:lipopolysaccharide biosynthesis protein [Bacteroidales bacterium]
MSHESPQISDNTQRGATIAKNTLFLALRMLVVLFVGLYATRVILDVLGEVDFGVYQVAGSVVVLCTFLLEALSNASYRYLAYDLGRNDREAMNKTFSTSVNVHVILAIIVFILCETIGLWYFNKYLEIPETRMYAARITYHFSVLSFCARIIKTPYDSVIIVNEKMNFYAFTSIIEAVFKLAIVYLLLVIAQDKLIVYAFLVFAVAVLMMLWYMLYCRLKFKEYRYKWYWNAQIIKKFVTYSNWSMLVNLVIGVVEQFIVFSVNKFSGILANAALGVANQVNYMLNQFLQSFTKSFNPQIVKSYAAGEREYFMKLIFSSSKLSFYLMLAMVVPLMLNVDFVLDLWLKDVPQGVTSFLIYILLYSLIDAYSGPLWMAAYATGNIKTHQIIIASIRILNIPLAYVMLKMGCPAWSALAVKAALNFICSLARPLYMTRLIGLDFKKYGKEVLWPILLVFVLSVPLPWLLSQVLTQPWIRLMVICPFSLLNLLTVAYFLGMDASERALCKRLLNKMIKRK